MEQIFGTLDRTQQTIVEYYPDFNANKDRIYLANTEVTSYVVNVKTTPPTVFQTSELDVDTKEWKQIGSDLGKIKGVGIPYHGVCTSVKGGDAYYSLLQVSDEAVLVSITYSNNMDKFESTLVKSVVYITVIVVGFFFIILMMWVITLIHPLNQMRNYIERVKLGKDAELHVNRKDEIGELADALISMRDELKKQEKTKEEMVHNISHDLKTPIATIKSYGESIKDGIYPYDTLEKSVDVIIENADRLENKVHSLLFMNRVEYLISQDCEGISSNMKEVVEKVILNIKVIKPEIEITTDLEEIYFDGLAEPWRVVVENIIENALRYAKTKIEVHLTEEDGLTIANDGPCMDEERIKVLFKPYEKGQGGKFGLGLSIVSKVVNANHFEVCGENTADGVIFRITREQPEKKGR